jgi:hypothetical protein
VPVVGFIPPFNAACDPTDAGGFLPAATNGGHEYLTDVDGDILGDAYLERTASDLYICVTGLDPRSSFAPPDSSDVAHVFLDPSLDRGGVPDAGDYRLDVTPGGTSSASGGCSGLSCALNPFPGPAACCWSGVSADVDPCPIIEVCVDWRAEFKINIDLLRGWAHNIGFGVSAIAAGPISTTKTWPGPFTFKAGVPGTWGVINLN